MYPDQYQQLLDFIDSNPEYLHDLRLRLLTPDLIALPEQFAQLVNVVAELTASFNAFAEETLRRLNSLERDVTGTKTDVAGLKTDVAGLKTDVAGLKNDVGTLNGNDIERRARENILNIAKDELNLSRGSILMTRGRETAAQFLNSIEAAEARGLITEAQADHVLLADIIIRARRGDDRQYVHGVFEISRTIRLEDIQRARDRADAVAAATKEVTFAAVIGGLIQPHQSTQANAMDVQVLIPAMFRPPETGEEPTSP